MALPHTCNAFSPRGGFVTKASTSSGLEVAYSPSSTAIADADALDDPWEIISAGVAGPRIVGIGGGNILSLYHAAPGASMGTPPTVRAWGRVPRPEYRMNDANSTFDDVEEYWVPLGFSTTTGDNSPTPIGIAANSVATELLSAVVGAAYAESGGDQWLISLPMHVPTQGCDAFLIAVTSAATVTDSMVLARVWSW